MKAPAFQWYAADYLADERVMLLSLESEAAYVRLLNYCWREGSIPANPALCAPMCKYADVKVIKPALALFMKSPSQAGRLIHKRLEEERAKQEEYRAKQSAKGKAGGRPRKADEKPEESHGKATALPRLNYGLTEGDLNESSLSTSSTSSTTNVVATPATLPAKATPKEIAAGQTAAGGADTFTASTVPMLNDPRLFAIVVDRLGYDCAALDLELYRKQIRSTAEAAGMDAGVLQFQNFVKKYLNNEKASPAGLIRPGGPVLLPNQIPSNAGQPFVPMGIPDKDSYLKPVSAQPAGQYMGGIG